MLPELWPKPFKHFDQVRVFLVTVCAVISLFVFTIASFLSFRNSELLLRRLRDQANNYADLILQMKAWNASYGGVYVEKRRESDTNPYLSRLGKEPEFRDLRGRVFSLRNHAVMVKELSQRFAAREGTRFRPVSLNPIDPENAPDPFEREALLRFEQGAPEAYRLERDDGIPPRFRFIHPLPADASCLECHPTAVGRLIGAISVTIPAATALRETDKNNTLIMVSSLGIVALLIGITYFLTWRLVVGLDTIQHRLKKLASTDELTGLANRRTIMQRLEEESQRARRLGEPLCVTIFDLDHFKGINDTYGHPFGDFTLKRVAETMRGALRSYDILGRIGGEEFILISVETTLDEAIVQADRVRERVGEESISDGSREVRITVSAGVTTVADGDETISTIMRRADAALYQAKQEGRNRVRSG
ncbi:sensor domain-containing diguanylate cyclase [Geobacter pickeringii]|uniref:diguanylate cyclase n=1 Tax=Geobacter pickeringii TaxID=345632 RepID=A0A0B5BHB3_9BACT|nr:diguanylate cyclase [Geobacter pickeringii]AJE03860.1 diguanylate cyclase [Geobacter pickeringii]